MTNKEWFYSTVPNIEENTGLNKYFQEESIKILKKYKVIETKVMGMPSKRYFKINFTELEKIFKNTKKSVKNTKKTPKNQGSNTVATKEVNQSPSRKQHSRHQGSKPVATKEATQSPPRKQHSRQHGGKPVATNNNNNNNKLININNNLILSSKDEKREDSISTSEKATFKNSTLINNINLNDLYTEYQNKPIEMQLLNNIINILSEIINSNKKYYVISGERINTKDFVNKIMSLNQDHIEYIITSLSQNTTKIKNIKAYILATIYNALNTIDTYYKKLNKL